MNSGESVQPGESDYREAPPPPWKHFSKEDLKRCILLLILLLWTPGLFAQRPLGTDVSGYQTNVDWMATKNGGVTFAWTKATEGASFSSSLFSSQEAGAHAVGIYIGAYHFARPSVNTNLTGAFSADTEAAFFWSVAGNYIKSGNGYLVPMLDWEDPNATNGYKGITGFTTAYMSAWVNEWCNSVSNFAQLGGVTIQPIVYTGTWYSNPANGYPGLDSTVTQWPSWIAYYPNTPNAQSGGPPSSYPWPTWTVWQYADTNWSGGDSDVLNGTADSLGALVIGGLDTPPYIAVQLVNHRAVDVGGNVSFSALAGGKGQLIYQWMFNGSRISGATNTTLALAGAQPTNAGNYSVMVTNAFGSVTSSIVSLTVYPPQAIVFSDNFETNSAANWSVNKSSADTAVSFSFDYSTLGIPSAPHSANSTTHGVQMKANLASGAVAALSLSPIGQSFAGDYRLHFDAWINVNGPFPGGGSGSTEFLTAGVGTAGNRTEWTGAGSTADGYYFSADGEGGVGSTSTTTGDYVAYTGAAPLSTGTGVYLAGTGTAARDNGNVYYTAAFSTGRAAPLLQRSNYAQQTGTLDNGTFGFAWRDVIVSRRGSTVDWVVDGVRLATISNATFAASNVFVGFWDPFASLSDNNNLSFGLVDNVRVEVPVIAPIITLQTNGTVQISFTGDAYWTYTIETSTDLVHWSARTNLTSTNDLFQFTDSTTNNPQLFYRARVKP